MPPVSKESSPCFLSVILLLEKSSKSLIPLSDCPFVLSRLPVFLGNLPVSGKKTGMARNFRRWSERTLQRVDIAGVTNDGSDRNQLMGRKVAGPAAGRYWFRRLL